MPQQEAKQHEDPDLRPRENVAAETASTVVKKKTGKSLNLRGGGGQRRGNMTKDTPGWQSPV